MTELLSLYTAQVLAHRLGAGDGGYADVPASPQALAPLERAGRRAGRLVLLGLGSGRAVAALERDLPPETEIVVLELSPDQARRAGGRIGRSRLVVDTSPLALLALVVLGGLWPGAAQGINPEVAEPEARNRLRDLGRLLAAYQPAELARSAGEHGARGDASRGVPGPDEGLCLGAILHPDEPDLEGFFAALPRRCDRAVVVWDAERPPDAPPGAHCPVLHLAHPLKADFAAQRNRMLAACRGEWVLVLDGDERMPDALAALLPELMARPDWNAVALARHGLRPGGVRVGYGLWPDAQLRLFRKTPGLRYVRPVHERLEGLAGATGLVLAPALLHLGDLVKDQAALARKHALFDKAGGGGVRHRQNAAFPELPERVFRTAIERVVAGKFAPRVNLAGLSS